MSQIPPHDYRSTHENSDGDDALQRPRRPKPETEARLLHGQPQPASHQMMKNYKLSVNAPEFVPRTGGNQGPPPYPPMPPQQLVNSFNQMNLSGGMNPYPGGAATYPMGNNQYKGGSSQYNGGGNSFSGGGNSYQGGSGNYPPGPNPYPDGMDQMTAYLLSEFSNTMMVLTTLPANIRDFLLPLCDKLRQAKTPEILEKVIEILYQQSIFEPNFRYTGARVVHFLCDELKDHAIFGHFKPNFLKKCQQDYNQREMLLQGGPEGVNTLCGLTLFMGELFLNVTAGSERLSFLPGVLTDLVLTLLSQPSDVTVKTACQLLKLAGGPTEDAMQSSPESVQNFNSIFTALNALQSAQHLSQNNKLLMNSVLNLKQNNWGRPENRPAQETHQANSVSEPEFLQSEPVFYDQYGKTISREQAGYFQGEEEEEDNSDGYELTEEEERDFLQWQEENSTHEERASRGPPPACNPNSRPSYGSGYPNSQYQPWSTEDSSYQFDAYSQNYAYSSYSGYPDEEGLTMDDEAEKAYEEFLSSHAGRPK